GGPSAQRVWRTGPADFNVRDFGEGAGGFENIFEQFFGRSRNARGARRAAPPPPTHGKDITHSITLPFVKAALGTKATIKLKTVGGPNTGKLQALNVTIPPGVTDGAKIRIRGKGKPSAGRAPAGDLYLKVSVEPHPYFWREGQDIYVELPISFTEAALGTRVDVPTLHGTTAVRVPAGVSSGQKLRLRGKGVPASKANAQAGDQYAVIKIVSPSKLSPEAEKLLKQFQQVCKFEPERFK
ncbi:MAG: J domain-containing protein, partial [Actinobacteria bacterium]|nr:J domain-containing protein [Actinomycetota bacterium]